MLFVLSGPSYVGKKTAIAHFMKLYSFSSIIPYTTKPLTHRIGETEGIQYHYVEDTERKDIENAAYIYDEPFNFGEYRERTLYAYKKSDLENAIRSNSNFIIHASVGNTEKMYHEFSKYHKNSYQNNEEWTQQIFFIFLNFSSPLTKEFFRQREPSDKIKSGSNYQIEIKSNLISNFRSKGKEGATASISSYDFNRRFGHAEKEVQFFKEHRFIFDEEVQSDKPYEICGELEKIILPKLQVMPTSPDKIPGPLSDVDIIYMCEKRKNDPLEISIGGKRANPKEIESLLCGCGIHISLSNQIRKLKQRTISSFIDMADNADSIEITLGKEYPTEVINNGYIMRPNEMILCSSDESVKLPQDIYAMVVSKFSYTQLGLSIELSQNIIQSGHNGRIHFQIKNNTNNYICIYPHIQVAQLLFFRTVQPSSKVYHEGENHSYDQEYPSPLPKFRNGNQVLDNVSQPQAGFFKRIFYMLREKLEITIVAVIAAVAISILWGAKLYEMVETYILPLVKNLPITGLVILFALVSCAANTFFYIFGQCILYVMRAIVQWIRRMKRERD